MLHQVAEQPPEDILRNGPDEKKCVAGRFLMTWPPTGGKKETLATISSSSTFRIFFELTEECLARLQVSAHDEFRLSLKGAVIQKFPQTPKLSSLPMQLTFSDGVHIQWKNQGPNTEIKTLNTWSSSLAGECRDAGNSWYLSDGESDYHQIPAKRSREQSEETTYPLQSETPNLSPRVESSATESKKYRRMEAKRQKLANREGKKSQTDDSKAISFQNGKALEDFSHLNSQPQASESVLEFHPGLRTRSGFYSAIKDIRSGSSVCLIGIVTNMSTPTTTHRGDWMRYIDIVDPSNYRLNDFGRSKGLKINCFTKRYKEWLPHPNVGDVIILRYVKIVQYQGGLAGTGYADKLRWAAFSPSKGEVHHGPPNNAPKQEGLADGGLGVPFSPFFQPDSPEIRYCVKLSDWWREAEPKADTGDTKLQIDEKANRSYPQTSRSPRVHRLISEAGPSVPPDGYFDCTIEVLKGVPSNGFNTVYTLFVTDYTRNEQVPIVQGNWCSSSLSEYVLQLEMWDAAAEAAQNMRPGQYYHIKNARMRINTAGYLEGKVAQAKITELKAADAETNTHLKSMLERKHQLEAKETNTESATTYQLIQDTTEGKFFNCAVELLHLVNRPGQTPHLYVTDYTSNPHLTANVVNSPWSRGLEKRIIKIFLSEEQQHVVDAISTGSYYYIRKLRLKHSQLEQGYCGFLGGNEKLLVLLNPNKTDNEHLNGLLRRREAWMNKIKRPRHDAPKVDRLSPKQPSPARVVNKATQPFTRIVDIREDAGPQTYQICAKVVDFYPLELREAFYQHCSRCNIEVPKRHKACARCSDFEHAYLEYKYQLFLMLEDELGYQIVVSVGDKCPLLAGLERGCLLENDAILRKFCDRLQPVCGDLAAMHEGLKSNEIVPVDTPYLCFEVGSWSVPDARPGYRLIKYEKLPMF